MQATDPRIGRLSALFQQILAEIDPEPARSGLAETPRRMAEAWLEWTSGTVVDPKDFLKTFDDGAHGYDSLVIVHNVPIHSVCEHHGAAITGLAHVGYLPNSRIVGLSKLARVADTYARRLQVQERLTTQIADTVQDTLGARATGVLIRATHHCMSSRGARVHGSLTTTSAMRGELTTDPALKAEFMALCGSAERARDGQY